MAEYNILYLSLNKRLSILKAKLPYLDSSLDESKKDELRYAVDKLLKKLDNYYSDGRYLDEISIEVDNLEKEF